jgi:hypothetical protein
LINPEVQAGITLVDLCTQKTAACLQKKFGRKEIIVLIQNDSDGPPGTKNIYPLTRRSAPSAVGS